MEAYGESHQNPVNKRIHWFCVPAIMLSSLALLSLVPHPVPGVHWHMVVIVAAAAYYALLSLPLALGMVVLGGLMSAAIPALAAIPGPLWLLAVVLFVVAWIGQFVGHRIEGKKPSFVEDLKFLLIGPMWLLAHVYRRFDIRY